MGKHHQQQRHNSPHSPTVTVTEYVGPFAPGMAPVAVLYHAYAKPVPVACTPKYAVEPTLPTVYAGLVRMTGRLPPAEVGCTVRVAGVDVTVPTALDTWHTNVREVPASLAWGV